MSSLQLTSYFFLISSNLDDKRQYYVLSYKNFVQILVTNLNSNAIKACTSVFSLIYAFRKLMTKSRHGPNGNWTI